MNSKLLLLMMTMFLVSPFTLAKSLDKNGVRTYYKCYLALNDKSDVVHGFVSVGKTQSEFESELEGRIVYYADGVTGSIIESVYECVAADKLFKSKEARELEAKTPF
ncbi:MAG: hypothetical protein ACJAT7_000263 [Psychromonas sp.]|jgi:hypothetical protein|uniref:TapY2 family type IVa secretion system protein n=1 Tax=Psychromonas sp. TaxID=1884585 RepID=UPI0039E4FDF1